nr:hypothetical protein Q903MT_gene2559 [Picea sitchensis]
MIAARTSSRQATLPKSSTAGKIHPDRLRTTSGRFNRCESELMTTFWGSIYNPASILTDSLCVMCFA